MPFLRQALACGGCLVEVKAVSCARASSIEFGQTWEWLTANRGANVAAGTVPLLIALLRTEQPAVLRAAMNALWNLAKGSSQNKDAIIAAGTVPLLIALLRSELSAVQQPTAVF